MLTFPFEIWAQFNNFSCNQFFYLFKQKITQHNLAEKKNWFILLCILRCVMQIYVCMVHRVVVWKLTSWKSKYKIKWRWFWKGRVYRGPCDEQKLSSNATRDADFARDQARGSIAYYIYSLHDYETPTRLFSSKSRH